MNPNPFAKRILCYGDSNTWGHIPVTKERYSADVRWTGLLQQKLGSAFEVIEEGLGSRTTKWEYAEKEGRNGKTYLSPCLESHNPLDLVILFLGTNDLKEVFNQTPPQIAASVRELIKIIKQKATNASKQPPAILLVSPAIVDESVAGTELRYKGAQQKSVDLGKEYEMIAAGEGCAFIDLAQHVAPSKLDGLHFEAAEHAVIAEVFENEVRKILE